MKKLIALLALTTLISTACVNNTQPNLTTEGQTTIGTDETSTTGVTTSVEPATHNSADGLPPLDDTLKSFFKEASELYREIEFGILPVLNDTSIQRDKYMYYRVNDARFATLEELRMFLADYFTDDIIENDMLSANKENPEYIDIDGALYQREIGRGGRIEYAGHVFGPVEQTESTIKIPVSVYYATDYQPETFFYTQPEDKNRYTIEEQNFELVKENDKWLFSKFFNFR